MTSPDASVSATSASGAMKAELRYTHTDQHLFLAVTGCESYGYILRGFPDSGPSWSTTKYGVTDSSVDLGEVSADQVRYEAEVTCDGENPWDEGDPAPLLALSLPAAAAPEEPSYEPMTIETFDFSESMWTRELAWKVSGCSEPNVVGVRTQLLFNGIPVRIQAHSAEGKTNASQFPTGTYTLKAECHTVDLAGDPESEKVLATTSKDLVLTRANLSTGFFNGLALRQNVLRPGDRAQYSSIHTHNRINLDEDKVAGSFIPGEAVEIYTELDGSDRTLVGEKTADDTGNISGELWIPFKESARSFGIFAIGKSSGHQLDFQSVVADKPAAGLVVSAGSTPLAITVESYDNSLDPNTSGPSAFEKNTEVALKVLDPEGIELAAAQTTARTSSTGSLEKVEVALPEGAADGRYTIVAPVPLFAGAHYAAYFFVKDGVVYPTWDGSGQPSGIDSEHTENTDNPQSDTPPADTAVVENASETTPTPENASDQSTPTPSETTPGTAPTPETTPEITQPVANEPSPLARFFTQVFSILSTFGLWLIPFIGYLAWPLIQAFLPRL